MGLPRVQADTNQLELALLNLATNARDAMPDGGKVIIAAHEVHNGDGDSVFANGHYVCLSLADQGEGMDEATLARATEPFFTTKGVGKGTGLGLPMIHGMTEQMGGRFVLKSQKGKGTTAQICLPLADEKTAAPEQPAAFVDESPVRSLTILAVDDDALVLLNTTMMLEDMGHRVIEAGSGLQALELLRKNKVDLIITDQAMPQMTGLQLLEAVAKENAGLPVLIATGYAELPAGDGKDIALLSKPFSSEELGRSVAAILRR
jgi:CheY-like chemotaxis protein